MTDHERSDDLWLRLVASAPIAMSLLSPDGRLLAANPAQAALFGFEPDERSYAAAGEILRRLGIARVRLLTNNPGKRAALDGLGVEVVDRVPLVIAANPHNEAYLRTKKLRDGHSF